MAAKKGSRKPAGAGTQLGSSPARRSSIDVIKSWRDDGHPAPLEVMLLAMKEELEDEENVRLGRANRRAFPFAVAAAVYYHPKPQAQFGLQIHDPGATARDIMSALRDADDTIGKPPA
jgi:hypothetical protein